jgi:hypothetical protein
MNIINLGSGKCSYFGGPNDTGVGSREGLSLIETPDLQEWFFRRIFLTQAQWNESLGLARNLNSNALYCAMRWAFGSFNGVAGEILTGYSREQVRRAIFIVTANGKSIFVQGADWGPNTDTGRIIDLSPGAVQALGVRTDDPVSVQAVI